ncbi:hypothetical protein SAMN05660900_02664, partial [Megasphaera cerevisiae DSM 20462]
NIIKSSRGTGPVKLRQPSGGKGANSSRVYLTDEWSYVGKRHLQRDGVIFFY